MGKVTYTISQAAKMTGVETHVLRFWEEELLLNIGRNAKGYRIYTKEDLEMFQKIRELKKTHALKDIRGMLGEKGKKRQQFFEIMEKVIEKSLEEKKNPEERYKEVDKSIRHHQHTRRLIAATADEVKKKAKGKKSKK